MINWPSGEEHNNDADPYADARKAARRGKPRTPGRTKAITTTNRETRLHGDGDRREGRAYVQGLIAAEHRRTDPQVDDLREVQPQFEFNPAPSFYQTELNGWDREHFRAQAQWLLHKRDSAMADLKNLRLMLLDVGKLPIEQRRSKLNSILRQAAGCIAEIEHADKALSSIVPNHEPLQGLYIKAGTGTAEPPSKRFSPRSNYRLEKRRAA